MASIALLPKNYPTTPASVIEHSDFENGFTVTQKENVFTFEGSWICPASFATNTQKIVAIDPVTKKGAIVIANFSQSGTAGKVSGTLTIALPNTPYELCGLAEAVQAPGATNVTTESSYINAPFLMGQLSMTDF